MKKRILWMLLSFLLVASLVLASCGKEEPGEQEEEEEVVGEVTVPQYGGTLTVLDILYDDLGSPDPWSAVGGADNFRLNVLEKLICGDIYTYGGLGNQEFLFIADAGTPLQYATGALAEGWDVTSDKVVIHIRPNVYWSGLSINPVMEPREYTADDYIFNISRRLEPDSPSGNYFRGLEWIKEPYEEHVYAEDDYTVVLETNYFHSQWDSILVGGDGPQMAPETVEAGPDLWENLVGTGPFYIKEYVPGSHMTFGANPIYWRQAPILGKLYDTPFVEELVMPLIMDESTGVAALRTATFDAYCKVPAPHVTSLTATNPELIKAYHKEIPNSITFNCAQPPFDNRDVRRALFIGTDRAAINAMQMNPDLVNHEWPIGKGWPGWVPMEELPESCQILYDYDPDTAKQMLRDAGVPDGFKMETMVASYPIFTAIAEMLVDQWALLGVELTINAVDGPTMWYSQMDKTYKDSLTYEVVNHTPVFFTYTYYGTEGPRNGGSYFSEYNNSRLIAALTEEDPEELKTMMEEVFINIIDDAPAIPFGKQPLYVYWWPWVKNCFGEVWFYHRCPDYFNWWIDQDLKAEMGY